MALFVEDWSTREAYVGPQRVLLPYVRLSYGLWPDFFPFVVSSGARQECPIPPFLFKFVMEDFLKNHLFGSLGSGVEFLPGNSFMT